jgi:hypothetical protein
VVYVKVPPGRGCGFVQFAERRSAERALAGLNGQPVGNATVRISWGRTMKPGRAAEPAAAQAMPALPPPVAGAYAGMYDAGAYGSDPYAAAAYSQQYGGYYGAGALAQQQLQTGDSAAQAAAVAAAAASAARPSAYAAPAAFDPRAPVDVGAMNAAYVARRLPQWTGRFLRPSPAAAAFGS